MKKIYTIVSILACLTFHACDNSKESMNNNVVDEAFPEFTAMIGESDTKTSLKGLDVIWSDDDRVAIFNGTVRAKEYKVKAGYSGSTTTILTPVNQDFTAGTEGAEMDGNVAFYPYSAVESCNKTDDGYTLTVNFPRSIKYSPSSFGEGSMPMVAVTDSKDDHNLSFKNLCGLLKLQLKGDGIVKSIQVYGNDYEPLCGNVTISTSNLSNRSYEYSGEASLVLDCGDGIRINNSSFTDFYIPLPPTIFRNGLSMHVTTEKGVFLKTTNHEVKICNSLITTMKGFQIDNESLISATPNVIYKTKNNKILNFRQQGIDGASVLSNTYYEDYGELLLSKIPVSFNSEIFRGMTYFTEIRIPEGVRDVGYSVFTYCEDLETVRLPSSLKIINKNAFFECASLKNIVLPEGLIAIEPDAFYKCKSLTSIEIPRSVRRLHGFDCCYALRDIVIHEGIEEFSGFANCYEISYINLPETIRVIGSGTFKNWGDAIIDFSKCKNLEQIGIYAFEKARIKELDLSSCTELKSMQRAFYKFNPNIIKMGALIPPTLGSNDASTAVLYVPAESIEAYKTADGWKDFKDIRAL